MSSFPRQHGIKVSPTKVIVIMAFVFGVLVLVYPNDETDLRSSIDTCPPDRGNEYAVINEVSLTTDLKDVDKDSLESLKAFCNPYDYAKVTFQGREYHLCVWQPQNDAIVSFVLHSGRVWEVHNMARMYNLTWGHPRGIVIDAGANVGLYTVVAASLGHTVFSFEPIKDHVEMIKKSLALNGLSSYVRLFRNGLGNFNGKSTIAVKAGNKGGSAVDLNTVSGQVEEVDLIRLDELFGSLSLEYPSEELLFWKADIEGWEERMFNGAKLWYTHYKPKNLLIELNANGIKLFQCNFGGFLDYLLDHYDFQLFYSDGMRPGPVINKENVNIFAAEYPDKFGHVYDAWLSAKH